MNFPKVDQTLAVMLAVTVGILITAAVYALAHADYTTGCARLVLACLGGETLHGIEIRR